MKLTTNFELHEFFVSEQYPEMAVSALSQVTGSPAYPFILQNLFLLCHTILQPVRDFMGEPVKILSGFRSYSLNSLIGGANSSYHLKGIAADFTFRDTAKLVATYGFIKNELHGLYGELIYYPDQKFIHVTLPTPDKADVSFVNSGAD